MTKKTIEEVRSLMLVNKDHPNRISTFNVEFSIDVETLREYDNGFQFECGVSIINDDNESSEMLATFPFRIDHIAINAAISPEMIIRESITSTAKFDMIELISDMMLQTDQSA